MTLEEHQKLFEKQQGRCAICNKHQSELNKEISIDHSHKTGKVRGLLCNNCNSGIGYFNDNKELLIKAISYLELTNDKNS